MSEAGGDALLALGGERRPLRLATKRIFDLVEVLLGARYRLYVPDIAGQLQQRVLQWLAAAEQPLQPA